MITDHRSPPRTAGEGGFWTTFDWPSAVALGAQDAGLVDSGEFGFATTTMAYPTTHMVQPKENALQCTDCHGDDGRLDWQALGYQYPPGAPGGPAGRLCANPTRRPMVCTSATTNAQISYFGLLNVLLPFQIITGALMWGVQQWPQVATMLGGLPFLAPLHTHPSIGNGTSTLERPREPWSRS